MTESVAYIETEARSCAFSTDGAVLAVGTKDGAVLILSAEDLSEISRIQDRKQARHCCAFSPDGELLAVGSNDNRVDIYSVSGDYEKVGCGSKASSFITQLDWSAESDYVAACDGAGERLVYDTSGSHITDSDLGSKNFYNLQENLDFTFRPDKKIEEIFLNPETPFMVFRQLRFFRDFCEMSRIQVFSIP